METIFDESYQIPNLQTSVFERIKSKPNDSYNHGNNDLHKKRLCQTRQFEQTIGIIRIDCIFLFETFFLEIFTSKSTNNT